MGHRLILVVDDEDVIRDFVAAVLISEGYLVAEASNGRKALRTVEESIPALILLDLTMSILDGFGFVTSLIARGIVVPIIVMSAATHLAKHAQDLGAVGPCASPLI
jgi:DNA-binding response OmpR family regulator